LRRNTPAPEDLVWRDARSGAELLPDPASQARVKAGP
jgi:hypothetical protein